MKRANRSGNVELLPSGRWRVRVTVDRAAWRATVGIGRRRIRGV